MSLKRVAIALVVLAVLSVAAAVYYVWFRKEPFVFMPAQAAVNNLQIYSSLENGVTTYRGTVPLAGACDGVSAGISVMGINPQKVTLALNIVQPAGTCPVSGTTSQEFSASLSHTGSSTPELVAVLVNGKNTPYIVANQ